MKGARRMYIFVILSVALSEYPSVILVSPSILLSLSPPPSRLILLNLFLAPRHRERFPGVAG